MFVVDVISTSQAMKCDIPVSGSNHVRHVKAVRQGTCALLQILMGTFTLFSAHNFTVHFGWQHPTNACLLFIKHKNFMFVDIRITPVTITVVFVVVYHAKSRCWVHSTFPETEASRMSWSRQKKTIQKIEISTESCLDDSNEYQNEAFQSIFSAQCIESSFTETLVYWPLDLKILEANNSLLCLCYHHIMDNLAFLQRIGSWEVPDSSPLLLQRK